MRRRSKIGCTVRWQLSGRSRINSLRSCRADAVNFRSSRPPPIVSTASSAPQFAPTTSGFVPASLAASASPHEMLCLNGLGTNAGFQRMAGLHSGATAKDLAYVRRRYVTVDALRLAIAIVSPTCEGGAVGQVAQTV